MGNLEIGFIDVEIVVEQDVDIDGSVLIGAALMAAPQFTLYLLSGAQHPSGGAPRLAEDDTIEKTIDRLKSPGIGLYQRRLSEHFPHPLANETDGFGYQLPTVAQITPESQIHFVYSLSTLHSPLSSKNQSSSISMASP